MEKSAKPATSPVQQPSARAGPASTTGTWSEPDLSAESTPTGGWCQIFILAIFSMQPPFAEVLSSVLLLIGLSFSPFRGYFDQVLFSPIFDCGFQNGAK